MRARFEVAEPAGERTDDGHAERAAVEEPAEERPRPVGERLVASDIGVGPGLGDDEDDRLLRVGERAPDRHRAPAEIAIHLLVAAQRDLAPLGEGILRASRISEQRREAGQVRGRLDEAVERGVEIAQLAELDRDDPRVGA